MKKSLRILALLAVAVTAITWIATGADRGWTKTSKDIKTLDEVTGIEGITHKPTFIAGVDFLALGFGGAVVLFGASFIFRKPSNKPNTNQTQTKPTAEPTTQP